MAAAETTVRAATVQEAMEVLITALQMKPIAAAQTAVQAVPMAALQMKAMAAAQTATAAQMEQMAAQAAAQMAVAIAAAQTAVIWEVWKTIVKEIKTVIITVQKKTAA